MIRKAVVIGNQVFDLGLKEFEESVTNHDKCLTLELEIGTTVFQVNYMHKEKALALNWWGLTSIRNIVWTRFVFLRLRRPFIQKVECFTDVLEGVSQC